MPPSPTGTPQPDWAALADGRLHRLRAGRDYTGDAREQIRAARAAGESVGRHVIVARDELGNAAFLWVQFVDGLVIEGDPCPGCGGTSLLQLGPNVVRCETCDRVHELRSGPSVERPPPVEWRPGSTPDTVGAPLARAAIRAARRDGPGGLRVIAPKDLLRDESFAEAVGRVLEARATRYDLSRLWTLWEAAGLAARTGGAGAAVGSTLAGGAAFVAVSLAKQSGQSQPCVVVHHPRFAQRAILEGRQIEDALRLLADMGASVVEGDVRAASAALGGHDYGLIHLDLADANEVADSLRLLHPRVLPGGVIVIEDYRIPVTGRDDRSARVAQGLVAFLAGERGYLVWQMPTRQTVLIRREA